VLKLPLLVDLQQKVGKLVLSITFCPSTIILENTLDQCIVKYYGKFNHRYDVSPIHLRAPLELRNFRKAIRACADRL
jgi:hypothetical protein